MPTSRLGAATILRNTAVFMVIGLVAATPAFAALVFDATESLSGQGLGAIATVLTVQQTGTESGCVAWNGVADVVGAAACPAGSGIAGGNEKTGANQTLTRTAGEVGLTDAADFRIIFNATESDSSLTLDDVRLTVYGPTGTVLFTSGPLTGKPILFLNTQPGIGSSGFVFKLDAAQITAANTASAFGNANNRIGLAAVISGAAGGNETFAVAKFTPVAATDADVAVTKSAPATVATNTAFAYQLTVTNFGPVTATNVVLVDTLPAGVSFSTATPSQGSCLFASPTVTCSLGSLAVNASATVQIQVTATASPGATLVNVADVSATQPDNNPSNNHAEASTSVVEAPTGTDVGLTKSAPATVAPNGVFTYQLTATNFGPLTATNVTVVDTLPAGVTFSSATPSQGSCVFASPTVTCSLGSLTVNASASVQIEVTATAAAGSTLVNVADVSATEPDPDPSNNHAEANTTVQATPIPTISEWGMMLLVVTIVGSGLWTMRRRRSGAGIGNRPA
jgi:uncharacterized repeat protein (TIGR01451 family)